MKFGAIAPPNGHRFPSDKFPLLAILLSEMQHTESTCIPGGPP